ncbi:MAG TPA: MYXO-CTERM sorting domain-containing protein [Polyangiaceae bacterium]|nr:MYXO-CTERM sorting domain-containing protein [Polyangiaceae bacterium]
MTVDASSELGPLNRFWQESVGADHLYTVLGSAEGANAQSAYTMAATELGMKTVRGHGILNDDVGIYSEVGGQPAYNWTNYDQIMDYILSQGMKPLVELSFMPSALASGSETFGWYNNKPGNISPPKDYDRWQALIYNLAQHSIERYGQAEVESWYFEVWNEPDLADFFSGTQAEYLEMYDRAVAGLMQASPNLKVGGPSVAIIGSGWIGALIDHCMTNGVKLDFISWHKYPYPADARPLNIGDGNVEVTNIINQKKAQYPALNVKNFLTEWNSSFTGGDSFSHEMGASFVAKAVHGMFEDQRDGVPPPDRAAFWVISDIWEEWDSRQGPAFDVMGLIMRKHDVRKPSYLAFQMLALMHDRRIAFSGGTSAETGLNGFATLSTNGKGVTVFVYDHNHGDGQYADAVTDTVTLQLNNLPFTTANVEVERLGVDHDNNNAFRVWDAAGRPTSPSEELWLQMKAAGALTPIQALTPMPLTGGSITLNFDQLQPGVSLIRIREEGSDPYEIPGGSGGTGGSGGASASGGAGGNVVAAGAGGVPTTTAGTGGVAVGGGAGGAAPTTGGASTTPPAAAAGAAPSSAGGCGCRAPGESSPAAGWAALLALAVGFGRRRRRV